MRISDWSSDVFSSVLLACEVTLQPLRRFDLDAAILFSDILTIPDAMGLGLSFETGQGPRFAHPVRSAADIAKLAVPDMETELRYVMDALRLIRQIGRAHVCTPVTNAHLVCRLMLEKKKNKKTQNHLHHQRQKYD